MQCGERRVWFVDELHLFNEQERLVFHQLTRDPDALPILFMALDPRQSPTETYAEFQIVGTKLKESGRAAKTFGDVRLIKLAEVYRSTPEILQLLRHIDSWCLADDRASSGARARRRARGRPSRPREHHPHTVIRARPPRWVEWRTLQRMGMCYVRARAYTLRASPSNGS
jgi:hypothetical protein